MLLQHLENSHNAATVFNASLLALAVHRVMVSPDGGPSHRCVFFHCQTCGSDFPYLTVTSTTALCHM